MTHLMYHGHLCPWNSIPHDSDHPVVRIGVFLKMEHLTVYNGIGKDGITRMVFGALSCRVYDELKSVFRQTFQYHGRDHGQIFVHTIFYIIRNIAFVLDAKYGIRIFPECEFV